MGREKKRKGKAVVAKRVLELAGATGLEQSVTRDAALFTGVEDGRR